MQIPKNLHILSQGLWTFSVDRERAISLLTMITSDGVCVPPTMDPVFITIQDDQVSIRDTPNDCTAFTEFIPEWIPMNEYLVGVREGIHKKNRECQNLRKRLKEIQ